MIADPDADLSLFWARVPDGNVDGLGRVDHDRKLTPGDADDSGVPLAGAGHARPNAARAKTGANARPHANCAPDRSRCDGRAGAATRACQNR